MASRYIFFSLSCLLLLNCQELTKQETLTETDRLNNYLDDIFEAEIEAYPMTQSYFGIKNSGQWDDISESNPKRQVRRLKEDLATVQNFDRKKLDIQGRSSYDLFIYETEMKIRETAFAQHLYPIDHLSGLHLEVVDILTNFHTIQVTEDALTYIERISNVPGLFKALSQKIDDRTASGFTIPRSVLIKVLEDSRRIISGFPFEEHKPHSILWKDLNQKLHKSTIAEEIQTELRNNAIIHLRKDLLPAYEHLIDHLNTLIDRYPVEDQGVWTMPNGSDFYEYLLKKYTTTDLSAEEIFTIGLLEIKQKHKELQQRMTQAGFMGDLKQNLEFLREDPRFYYKNTEEDKAEYLKKTRKLIEKIEKDINTTVDTKVDIPIEVQVANMEKSAGSAFYLPPSFSKSRPGIFFIDLSDMKALPKFELEALTFHESIPGHHLQVTIAQGNNLLPKMRRYNELTAFSEGWAYYAEEIPKNLGYYQDDMAEIGRITMALLRACRAVADVGLHQKGWSRTQTLTFLKQNTPLSQKQCTHEVDRYLAWPGQATSYLIGKSRISQLKERAQQILQDKYTDKIFHDLILTTGPLPFNILEAAVDDRCMTMTEKKIPQGKKDHTDTANY